MTDIEAAPNPVFGKTGNEFADEVFSVKDTLCNIFSFLNIFSLIKCQFVCQFWNLLASDASSSNGMSLDLDECINRKKKCFINDLARFRNADKLDLNLNYVGMKIGDKHENVEKFAKVCQDLKLFNKLKEVSVFPHDLDNFESDDYGAVDTSLLQCSESLCNCISRNSHHLRKLFVWGDTNWIRPRESDDGEVSNTDLMNEMLINNEFRNLEHLILKNFIIVYLDSWTNCFDNLKHLELGHLACEIELEYWRHLVKLESFQTGLKRLKSFVMDSHGVHISLADDEMQKFEDEILPQIAKNLVNLEKLHVAGSAWLVEQISQEQHKINQERKDDETNENHLGLKDVCVVLADSTFSKKSDFKLDELKTLGLAYFDEIEKEEDRKNMNEIFGKNIEKLDIWTYHVSTDDCYISLFNKLIKKELNLSHLKHLMLQFDDVNLEPTVGVFNGLDLLVKDRLNILPLFVEIRMQSFEGFEDEMLGSIAATFRNWFCHGLVHFQVKLDKDDVNEKKKSLFKQIEMSEENENEVCQLCRKRGDDLFVDPSIIFSEDKYNWQVEATNVLPVLK